jgi:imidazolonepropionase-like amidohydrolase
MLSLCLILVTPALFFAQDQDYVAPDHRPRAFTHVSVIDMTGGPVQPDMTVIVSGNGITGLGKTATVAIPKGTEVTDARGKFMIPGLWDMHQHTFMRKSKLLPLYSL